jgi:hypothetical protein
MYTVQKLMKCNMHGRCACTVQYQHICMRAFKKQNTLYYLLLKALLQCMFRSYSTVCVWQYIITVIAAAQKNLPRIENVGCM